ncbi:MAG: ribonuclease P protein component [Victivallaceae bacterium]
MVAFPKASRLLKSGQFQFVMRNGKCVTGDFLKIYVFYHKRSFSKLGITVSRKFGKAVDRNYFKRIIREVFRLNQCKLTSVLLVVFPKIYKKKVSFRDACIDFESLLPFLIPTITTSVPECNSGMKTPAPSSLPERS